MFQPIVCTEFTYENLDPKQVKLIQKELEQKGLEITNNNLNDSYLYYRTKTKNQDIRCSNEMFVAQEMLNEYFGNKNIELIKLESMIRIDGDDGSVYSGSYGIRVYYRVNV